MQTKEECVLDQAQITAVPPDTFQVMASYMCGGIHCWERWAQVGEQRLAMGRVCEKDNTSSDRRDLAPQQGGP